MESETLYWRLQQHLDRMPVGAARRTLGGEGRSKRIEIEGKDRGKLALVTI